MTTTDDDLRRNAMSQRKKHTDTALHLEEVIKNHYPHELIEKTGLLLNDLSGTRTALLRVGSDCTIEDIMYFLDSVVRVGLVMKPLAMRAADLRQFIRDDLGE
jgi:hypothetical protein